MGTAVMLISILVMLVIGVPIGVALALGMCFLLMVDPVTKLTFIAQGMYSGVASFTLLCLPFFILCGSVMESGGISKRIVNAVSSLIGEVTGSLGTVAVLSCMFFGAISGSAPATTAAIGAIMIPQMIRNGYDKYYATALHVVAGGLGVLVPPSFTMVVYGSTNNVSVGDLFKAGILPSVIVGAILILFNYIVSKKNGWKGSAPRGSISEILKTWWDAKWALFMPIIILGGIYGGVFSATEAAVIATVYGIFVGLFIYKELTLVTVWKHFRDNIAFLGGMLFVFAPAGALGSIFAYQGIPNAVVNFFMGITTNINLILVFILILLFIAGMFIQTTPMIVIFSPMLLEIVSAYGMSPIQFGVVMTMALCIAFVTPPVAVNLFVGASMTGLDMGKIVRRALIFIGALFIALILVTYVRPISLCLL